MIVFILNTFFYAIKLLAYSWFTNDQLYFKVVIIGFLIAILNLLYRYPRPLANDIDVIANHYKIHSTYEKVLCYIMLALYCLTFLGGILFLRIVNQNKPLNLSLIWNKFYSSILSHTYVVSIINITLIFLLILSYILLIILIINLFKKYWIKLHIYYSSLYEETTSDKYGSYLNWYESFIYQVVFKYSYDTLIMKFMLKLPKLYNKRILGFPIYYHLIMLVKKIHYISLLIVFGYDLIYNNGIIYNVYRIFPYIFIYDIYIRFCNLYQNLDVLYSADTATHNYLYVKEMELISKEEIRLDDNYYSITFIAKIISIYLKNGLNARLLSIAIDGHDQRSYTYNYYKDLKKSQTSVPPKVLQNHHETITKNIP